MKSSGTQSDTVAAAPVDEVIDRWKEGGVQYEKVLTADGELEVRRAQDNAVRFEG